MPELDDTDARFRALIEAEYGAEADSSADDPVVEPAPRQALLFHAMSDPRSWTAPDEEDEYVPPPVEPIGHLSTPALVAIILLVGALVVGVCMVARVPLPWWAPPAGLIGFMTGLGLAFSRLPQDRRPGSGDGAVV